MIERRRILAVTVGAALLATAPGGARALTLDDSSHLLSVWVFANDHDSASLPGSGYAQFEDSLSLENVEPADGDLGRSTVTLAYDVGERRITTSATVASRGIGSSGNGNGLAQLTIDFSVAEPVDWVLDGLFEVSGDVDAVWDFLALWRIEARLEDASGAAVFDEMIFDVDPETFSPQDFLELDAAGTLAPGSYTLSVSTRGEAKGHDFFYPYVSILAESSVSLTLLPEPGTGALLSLALLAGLRRRRVRVTPGDRLNLT